MVAAGGAAGAMSSAHAATITTVNFDIAPTASPTPVNLAGASLANAQFTYGDFGPTSGDVGPPIGVKSVLDGQGLQTIGSALYGPNVAAPGLPSPGESYQSGLYLTVKDTGSGPTIKNSAEDYLHLKFSEGGQTYLGYADIAGASDPSFAPATLKSVSFAAVPEPQTWALLISGLGVMGAALRRQRRSQLQPAVAR